MIENIFFLRRQRSTMNNGENHYVNSGNVNDDHDDQSGGNNDTENDSHLQLSNQQQLTPAPTACINLLKYDSDNSLNSHSALRRIKDGPAILAEYGQLTTAGKTATCEKICQKRLRPSDFEIKTAQKKLKYQKPTNSVTILTEFEAVLLARNAVSNGDFEFLRPSDLKLNRNSENFKLAADTQYYGPKFSLPNVCPTAAENLGSLKTNPEDLNSSNSIHQVLKSCLSPVESQSSTNQKGDKMASVINIMNKDTLISGSSQAADTSYSSSVRDEVSETESIKIGRAINHTQANIVFPTLESYVNEFVGKIIHSVIEMNKERRKCSQRNSETFQITDTVASTALTSDNCPVPKQESIVKFSNTSEGVEPDGANKNILICTERILKENIDQQIEDVIIESVAKTTAVGVIADSNSNDTLKRDKYNSEGMSVRRVNI